MKVRYSSGFPYATTLARGSISSLGRGTVPSLSISPQSQLKTLSFVDLKIRLPNCKHVEKGARKKAPNILLQVVLGAHGYSLRLGLILGLYRDNGKENGNYLIPPTVDSCVRVKMLANL